MQTATDPTPAEEALNQLILHNTKHTPNAVCLPLVWIDIHDRCFDFPIDASLEAKAAMRSYLMEYIPQRFNCDACKMHYKVLLEQMPVPENMSRTELVKWSVLAHNAVNFRMGKPQVSFEEAFAEHVRRQNSTGVRIQYLNGTLLNDYGDVIWGMGLALVIVGTLMFIYGMRTKNKKKQRRGDE